MKTQFDPKVDYAFKHVFGREESKPALVSLLNAVLQPAEGEGIASLEQLHQGEKWAALRPTIEVCFVDTPLVSELDDYHLTFELRERRHQTLFTDRLALHILELSRFRKDLDDLTTSLDRWLYFLRHGEDLDAEAVPMSLDVPEVRWALGDLFMISRIDPERELYEARLQERRDKAAERQALEAALAAQEAAREKGLSEGARGGAT